MMMEQWNNEDEVMADNEVGEKEGEEVSLIFCNSVLFYLLL